MQAETLNIGNRRIGYDEPVFIIAEAGVNHNGDLLMAKKLIDVAVEAGADAVKFQTFHAERMLTAQAPKAAYQLQRTDESESQLAMIRRLELSREAHQELRDYCQRRAILFMSTPFDEESADLLDELGVPAFKVASGEITNWPLLDYIARKGKPLILSTGMSHLGDIYEAVRVINEAGNERLVLLQCTTNYPANPAETNLRAMRTMNDAFGVFVGYSDHTEGIEISLGAVALGARVIEKHFTLDKTLPGPDHQASLEPDELKALVHGVRKVEAALGSTRKTATKSEAATAKIARRSLVAAEDIPAGTRLTCEMIAVKRPGTGLSPAMLPHLVGRIVRVDVRRDALLGWDILD